MAKLVLKASAGTGKTFRLSLEFLLSLLKSPNYKNYENILIMTFTKKATAEIKKEVLDKIGDFSKINELVKENPNDDVLDIIKKSNIEEKLKDKYETLLKVIEKLYKNKITKSDLIKLSKIYEDIIKNKEKLKIYTIDSFLNIIFKNISTNFLKIKNYNIIDEDENEIYYKKILENIFKNKKLFSDFREFFTENSEKDIDKYIETIKNLIDGRWKYLISLSENQNFYLKEKFNIEKPSYEYLKEIFKYIQEECGKDLEDSLKKDYKKYILKSDNKLIKLLQNDFKLIFASEAYNGNKFRKKDDVPHKEYLLNLQEKLRESLAQEIYNEILIPYESKLMELNREIYKIYDEIKIRERRFTFNDIAIYAYMSIFEPKNLLIDKNGLSDFFYEALDMKIDTIFIDEFQDTSVLQWKILFEIIKKSENVICVGDEKQSIYGWRGGEKRLFENLDTIINADNETMDISYRSDINIVEYTNKIFNKISSEEEKWKFENSKANSKEKGYVKAIFLEKTKEEENSISIERKLVNELIKTDLKNYSDIAIIARKNSELKEIAEILEEEKIPYKLSFEKNINNLSGVFELIQLLKYLIFDRELSLFNFLASDLSFFGTDEIEFLLKNKEETLNYLNGIENLNFNKTLSGKISLFLEKIKKIKEEYINYSTQDLVYRIFNEFNFYEIFNKDIELKNLTEVFLFSKKYENLFDLLKAFEKNEIEFSENAIESSAVELLTIHKSKGLQFKTVFVLNKKDKNRTQALDFIFTMDDNYNTVKFSLFTKKSYEKVIEICFKNEIEKLRLNQREEEINNLYVALTRAKNNLIFLSENEKYFSENELKKIEEIGELKFFPVENLKNTKENRNYALKNLSLEKKNEVKEKIIVNSSKFLLKNEEKRMLGILIHYFLENIKKGEKKEIEHAKKLCYKNYLSYFGEEKLKKIFSEENLKKIFEIAGDIFSDKWHHIYSEYEIYDYEEKKSYRIDRLMIKDEDEKNPGEIFIIDYKTGNKNDIQLENYKKILLKNFGEEIKNYEIKTKFLEFNIDY